MDALMTHQKEEEDVGGQERGEECGCLCVSELPPLEWTHLMDLDSVVILEQGFTAFWGFWV